MNTIDFKPGDLVRIKVKSQSYEGLVMPRTQYEGPEHITIKLKNGYNIGLSLDRILESSVIKRGDEAKGSEATVIPSEGGQVHGDILLLSTGGTIASRVDYRTGAVKPAFSSKELAALIPELGSIASFSIRSLMSVLSENIRPSDWTVIAKAVQEAFLAGFRGVVIAHGTDTMHYTAAALSFALENPPGPVVLVGSQRSSDRPSSDAATNLIGAFKFASSSRSRGVFIAMHSGLSDDSIAIHLGVRVRKNHTSRRNAFHSVNRRPVAYIKGLTLNENTVIGGKGEFIVRPNFDDRAALVKFFPGMKGSYFKFLVDEGVRAIIIEGGGLGHVSEDLIQPITEGIKKGVFFGMTSQCIWGSVNLNVYETGRDLLSAGVVPLGDMLSEVALAKSMWVLGNGLNATGQMPLDLRGEVTRRRWLSVEQD